MFFPWVLCCVLLVVIIVLFLKILFLKKSIDEICTGLIEHLSNESNTLISISTNDKHIKHFAAELNKQLRLLREKRRRLQNGDLELKEAVTNISHDLRTPLTAICGYLDLLKREDKSEDANRYIKAIENRTEALKQLTEELFRYSVITSTADNLTYENVVLNSALEESISSYYAALKERGITPEISIPEQKIERRLDCHALSRILGNIISNAIKYSNGDLHIILNETGEITFSNTALQLDEIQVGKLFDRFYTVDDGKKSTGLGLSIAKMLTEQMHGTISAQYYNSRITIKIAFED